MTLTTLVTLDGTEKDARALAVGAAFAELAGGRVRMVRVFDAHCEARSDVAEAMRVAVSQLDNRVAHCATWDVIENPDVAGALLNDVAERGADFVVMATRAAGAIDRAIRGSVADRLVRESPCAVMLVPPRAEHLRESRVRLRRVLVPLDESLVAATVTERLLALRRVNTLEVVLLTVAEPERTGGYMVPPGTRTAAGRAKRGERTEWINPRADVAERHLEAAAERLRGRGATADIRIREANQPGAVILETARDEVVDFIAMTTRGEGGAQRLVLGSVAEYVVRHSDRPVLVVTPRPSDARALE